MASSYLSHVWIINSSHKVGGTHFIYINITSNPETDPSQLIQDPFGHHPDFRSTLSQDSYWLPLADEENFLPKYNSIFLLQVALIPAGLCFQASSQTSTIILVPKHVSLSCNSIYPSFLMLSYNSIRHCISIVRCQVNIS